MLAVVILVLIGSASVGFQIPVEQPGAASAREMVYNEIVTLPSFRIPLYHSWAPSGHHLALINSQGLYMIDCETVAPRPRLLVAGQIDAIAWSPSGTLIACGERRSGDTRIVEASSGAVIARLPKSPAQRLLWTGSNTIHQWGLRSTEHRAQSGPRSGAVTQVVDPSVTTWRAPTLVAVWDRMHQRSVLVRIDEATQSEAVLTDATDRLGAAHIFVCGSFGNGTRFLVSYVRHGVHNAIVDASGALVCEFPHTGILAGFEATSIASDGRFVVGFTEDHRGEDLVGSAIVMTDSCGGSVYQLRGTGNGGYPRLSSDSRYLAFTDPTSGAVHVGTLSPPR